MEKGANEVEAFVIGDVGCGPLAAWLAIEVLVQSADKY